MDRTAIIGKRFIEDMDTIDKFRQHPEMGAFTEWLLATESPTYEVMPEGWGAGLETSDGLAAFLKVLHHALYDDGDVCFVDNDGYPRMCFTDYHDTEGAMRLSLNKFTELADAAHEKYIHRCFKHDANHHGVEFAVENYKHYSCYKDSWSTAYAIPN